MSKYEVELEESIAYTLTVEADSFDDASTKAEAEWAASKTPIDDFDGQPQGVTVKYVDLDPEE